MSDKTGLYSNHPLWGYEQRLWTLIGNIAIARRRAEVAMTQADNADLRNPEPSQDQIFLEMDQAIKELNELQDLLVEFKQAIREYIEKDTGRDSGILSFKKAANE